MPAPKKRTAPRKRHTPEELGVIVLRVTLRYVEPAVWREISVPDFFTLQQLHRVLQCAFAWMDYHLHEFQVRRERFVPRESELDGVDTAQTTLASLGLKRGSKFVYSYDYGDGWEHDLEVVAMSQEAIDPRAIPMPRILDGQRAAPPEDSGGPPGYARLCDALMDPTHPEHAQAHDWVPRGFDPDRFDLPGADHGLVLACAWGAI